MDITKEQLNNEFLKKMGTEASSLLVSANYKTLVNRFGYALSHNREPEDAFHADITEILEELKTEISSYSLKSVDVGYFDVNNINITSIIGCELVSTESKKGILLDLIVTGKKGIFINRQGNYSITIEGISIVHTPI